jgi:hypothetical protein
MHEDVFGSRKKPFRETGVFNLGLKSEAERCPKQSFKKPIFIQPVTLDFSPRATPLSLALSPREREGPDHVC